MVSLRVTPLSTEGNEPSRIVVWGTAKSLSVLATKIGAFLHSAWVTFKALVGTLMGQVVLRVAPYTQSWKH